jgi:hypothetical protein
MGAQKNSTSPTTTISPFLRWDAASVAIHGGSIAPPESEFDKLKADQTQSESARNLVALQGLTFYYLISACQSLIFRIKYVYVT